MCCPPPFSLSLLGGTKKGLHFRSGYLTRKSKTTCTLKRRGQIAQRENVTALWKKLLRLAAFGFPLLDDFFLLSLSYEHLLCRWGKGDFEYLSSNIAATATLPVMIAFSASGIAMLSLSLSFFFFCETPICDYFCRRAAILQPASRANRSAARAGRGLESGFFFVVLPCRRLLYAAWCHLSGVLAIGPGFPARRGRGGWSSLSAVR